MTKTYGELKIGDVINWYGGKCRIVNVWACKKLSEYFPGERIMNFEIEPVDDECVKILGNFYSHGTYGGVEHLEVFVY